MKRVAFRIIPKEREWVVKPLVDGITVNKLAKYHTSRSKAWDSIKRNFFKYHTGRHAFNIMLEVEDEKVET